MGNNSLPAPSDIDKLVLAELQALRLELRELRALFHDFAKVFLDSKFKYGRAVDRFAQPRSRGGGR